jgi:hypothetical protein
MFGPFVTYVTISQSFGEITLKCKSHTWEGKGGLWTEGNHAIPQHHYYFVCGAR